MRVVGIVQARVGSTRLPGKVLMDLAGVPLALHTVRRLARATLVDQVVVATSSSSKDDSLVSLVEAEGIPYVRGSEEDVLSRFTLAARETEADVVVRVTADCPLIDPGVVDDVVGALLEDAAACDYASNVLRRTFPRGLDAEAMFTDVLTRIDRLATSPEAREHVTWLAYRERPDLFLLRSVELEDQDYSHLDWSVDTEEDLERVRQLVRGAGAEAPLEWRTLLEAC